MNTQMRQPPPTPPHPHPPPRDVSMHRIVRRRPNHRKRRGIFLVRRQQQRKENKDSERERERERERKHLPTVLIRYGASEDPPPPQKKRTWVKLVGNVLFFSFENKVRVVAVLPPCFVLLGKTLERNHFHGRNWFLLFLFTAFRNEKKNESYEAENHTKSICLSMSVVPSFTVFSIVFDSNGILVAVSSTVQRKFGYSRFDYGRFPSGSTRPPSCSVNKKKTR